MYDKNVTPDGYLDLWLSKIKEAGRHTVLRAEFERWKAIVKDDSLFTYWLEENKLHSRTLKGGDVMISRESAVDVAGKEPQVAPPAASGSGYGRRVDTTKTPANLTPETPSNE